MIWLLWIAIVGAMTSDLTKNLPLHAQTEIYFLKTLQNPTPESLVALIAADQSLVPRILTCRNYQVYIQMPQVILQLLKSDRHVAALRSIFKYPLLVDWSGNSMDLTEYIMGPTEMEELIIKAFELNRMPKLFEPESTTTALHAGITFLHFLKLSLSDTIIQSLHPAVQETIVLVTLKWSSYHGLVGMVRYLFNQPRFSELVRVRWFPCLLFAVANGQGKVMDLYFSKFASELSENQFFAFGTILAIPSAQGNEEMVSRIARAPEFQHLIKGPSVLSISVILSLSRDLQTLNTAPYQNFLRSMNPVLQDELIKCTIVLGHTEFLNWLLLRQIIPFEFYSSRGLDFWWYILSTAITTGQDTTVAYLLQLPEMQSRTNAVKALIQGTASTGNPNIFKQLASFLIQTEEAQNRQVMAKDIFIFAAHFAQPEIVVWLLDEYSFDRDIVQHVLFPSHRLNLQLLLELHRRGYLDDLPKETRLMLLKQEILAPDLRLVQHLFWTLDFEDATFEDLRDAILLTLPEQDDLMARVLIRHFSKTRPLETTVALLDSLINDNHVVVLQKVLEDQAIFLKPENLVHLATSAIMKNTPLSFSYILEAATQKRLSTNDVNHIFRLAVASDQKAIATKLLAEPYTMQRISTFSFSLGIAHAVQHKEEEMVKIMLPGAILKLKPANWAVVSFMAITMDSQEIAIMILNQKEIISSFSSSEVHTIWNALRVHKRLRILQAFLQKESLTSQISDDELKQFFGSSVREGDMAYVNSFLMFDDIMRRIPSQDIITAMAHAPSQIYQTVFKLPKVI